MLLWNEEQKALFCLEITLRDGVPNTSAAEPLLEEFFDSGLQVQSIISAAPCVQQQGAIKLVKQVLAT